MSDVATEARALLERLGVGMDADDLSLERLAALLADHETRTSDRDTRKVIRRALYRLRQHGVASPTSAATVPRRPLLAPAIDGFVSAVDGRGDRLIWLVRELPTGGLLLVTADVNEPAGLRDLRVFDVTRKQLRAMRLRFQTEAGLRLVAADWRALDALIVEAEDRAGTPESRRRAYRHQRARLTGEPPLAPGELASPHATAPDDAIREGLVAESATLLAEPEFRTWWPLPEAAAPVISEIREIRESPLVLSDVQQQERLREVLARATTSLYPPPVVARRLQGTAYVLAETDRVDAARRALAVAAMLVHAPERASAIPFLQALTQQGVGAHLAAQETERTEERQSALVRTPAELATARSPSRRPRPRA
ncbi:MAG: hypothetical protein ACREQL_04420 [Candidatus Binatia bacterium]